MSKIVNNNLFNSLLTRLALTAFTFLSVLAVSGCGKTNKGEDENTSKPSSGSTSQQQTPPVTPPPVAGQPCVELTFDGLVGNVVRLTDEFTIKITKKAADGTVEKISDTELADFTLTATSNVTNGLGAELSSLTGTKLPNSLTLQPGDIDMTTGVIEKQITVENRSTKSTTFTFALTHNSLQVKNDSPKVLVQNPDVTIAVSKQSINQSNTDFEFTLKTNRDLSVDELKLLSISHDGKETLDTASCICYYDENSTTDGTFIPKNNLSLWTLLYEPTTDWLAKDGSKKVLGFISTDSKGLFTQEKFNISIKNSLKGETQATIDFTP